MSLEYKWLFNSDIQNESEVASGNGWLIIQYVSTNKKVPEYNNQKILTFVEVRITIY